MEESMKEGLVILAACSSILQDPVTNIDPPFKTSQVAKWYSFINFVNSASVLTVVVTSVIGLRIVFPNKLFRKSFAIALWTGLFSKDPNLCHITASAFGSSPCCYKGCIDSASDVWLTLGNVTNKDYDEERKLNNFIPVRCTRVTLASLLMLRGFV